MTFKDLDGNDVTEDFYFSLSKAEITEMELSYSGGLSEHRMRIVKAEDGGEIIATFKKIILAAVGERSEDGRRFIKSEEISNNFSQTQAYSDLFMELVVDGEKAAEFVNAIVPSDLVGAPVETIGEIPDEPWIKENRDPTKQEVMSMTPEQLRAEYVRKNATVETPTTE